MTQVSSLLPAVAVGVSAAAVPLVLASRTRPNVRETWTFAAALVKFAVVLSTIALVVWMVVG